MMATPEDISSVLITEDTAYILVGGSTLQIDLYHEEQTLAIALCDLLGIPYTVGDDSDLDTDEVDEWSFSDMMTSPEVGQW